MQIRTYQIVNMFMSIPEKPEIAKCHVALCSRTPLPFKKGRLKTSKAGFSDGLYLVKLRLSRIYAFGIFIYAK